MGKGFWDMDFSKAGFHGKNAYDTKNKPFDHWYEYLLGPTWYDKKTGTSGSGLSPMAGVLEGSLDTEKAWSGSLTGAKIGTNISPGWGTLIGGAIGGGAGGTFVGEEGQDDGLAAAFRGNVSGKGMYGKDSNYLQMITSASDIYGGGNWYNNIFDYMQPDRYRKKEPGQRNEQADFYNSILKNYGGLATKAYGKA